MEKEQDTGRVTLQDIAAATGYTVNTVSRALKNKSDISKATCEKIQQVAQSMGYVRNYVASSLRSGRTKTIAVILGGMSNPYYGVMADEIQRAASVKGYSLIILCSWENAEQEYQMAQTAISRCVDGVLLFPGTDYERTEELLRNSGTPYILVGRYNEGSTCDTAVCDEARGAYLAATHLLKEGHAKIAMLSAAYVPYASRQRTEGFLKACSEYGFTDAEKYVAFENADEGILRRILAWKEEGITGIFAFCDIEAWNIVSLLEEHGIRVPEDIAIIGFDNIQERYRLPFPLCSVGFDMTKMAKDVVQLLRRRIHHENLPLQAYVYPVELICRGSCGCHKASNHQ